MLHVPVAVITDRLRAQSLEDDPLKVQREGTLQIEGKNVWVANEGDNSKNQDGTTITNVGTTISTTPTRERGMSGSTSLPFLPPLHDSDRMMVAAGNIYRTSSPGAFPASPRVPGKPAVVRVRSGGLEYGSRCETHGLRAFDTPPKKKQCRSLSVPVDSPPQGVGPLSLSPFMEGAKVWRPIPIAALTSSTSSVCMAGCGTQPDPRTSGVPFMVSPQYPDARTFSSFTTVGSTSARFYRDFKVVGVGGGGGGGVGTSTFPLAPSPLSVDSGRDTTSEPHTPSQSPVPRPASASSVRSHAFCSGTWWTHSPAKFRGSGGVEVFPSRSESYEEQISMGFQVSAVGTTSAGSSPCVVGSAGVVPLSPCRIKIPRCHSQPCVLHHRRYAKKRRRDDRPTLDFHKMTETAYTGKPGTITPAQDIQRRRWGPELDTGPTIGGLMPIASSPRDSDLSVPPPRPTDLHPARATDLHSAARENMVDLDIAARAHLPSTPPPSDVSSGIDIREPVKLIGEEEEEELEDQEEDSNCGCHRDSEIDNSRGLFPLIDLDLEQIENH